MNEQSRPRPDVEPTRSFDLVAAAYDRARPSYPEEAVAWLLDGAPATDGTTEVLEVGAGTGQLTTQLLARGCRVTAVEPSEGMLTRLTRRAPEATAVPGTAEELPAATRSVDAVLAAQCFSLLDTERAVEEAARVLRPGGRFGVVWSRRDDRIPWVKRLGRILEPPRGRLGPDDPAEVVDETGMFEIVEHATFRFWQPLTQDCLRDLVRSQPHVALMSDFERERVLRQVDDLYAEYGRGADGMLLPYVTTACRTAVLPWAIPEEPEPVPEERSTPGPGDRPDPMDDDSLLIDFR